MNLQADTGKVQLVDLGIGEPAARITIGNSSAADLEGEEHGPEVRLHVGKGELEVSRDDLTILTQCTISMISALVASYSELCTLNALLWGGSGAGGHSPAARCAPASRGESSYGVGGSGMSGSSVALGDAGRQERVGWHVDAGPRLPQWALLTRVTCCVPFLSMVIVQSRVRGEQGIGRRQGHWVCASLVDLTVATGCGVKTGQAHLHSLQVTYCDAASAERTADRRGPTAGSQFPVVFEMVPHEIPCAPQAMERGLQDLATNQHGFAIDWTNVAPQEGGEGVDGGTKEILDIAVRIGRVKIALTKEPLVFVAQASMICLGLLSVLFLVIITDSIPHAWLFVRCGSLPIALVRILICSY